MRESHREHALSWFLAGILLAFPTLARSSEESSPSSFTENVLVERSDLVVDVDRDCPPLDEILLTEDPVSRAAALSDWLDVRVGSRPARVDGIETALRPGSTLHVLAIDVSQLNMWMSRVRGESARSFRRPSLDLAREFAERYVRRVVLSDPNARAMLVTFGDDLSLVAGPSRDTEAIAAALRAVPAGYESRTYDGLYDLLRWLGPRDERKVVVIVTGMADSHPTDHFGASYRTGEEIRGLAAGSARGETTVFHLDLWFAGSQFHGRGAGEVPGGRPVDLDGLVTDSGGQAFRVETEAGLAQALDSIDRALARRRVVISYVPPDHGTLASCSSEPGFEQPWTSVHVRSRSSSCEARALRPEVSIPLGQAPADDVEAVASRTLERRAPDGTFVQALRLARVHRGLRESLRGRFASWDSACELPVMTPTSALESSRLSIGEFIEAAPSRIGLCALEPGIDNGLLSAPVMNERLPYYPPGEAVLTVGGGVVFYTKRPEWVVRRRELRLPPLNEVVSRLRTPGDVLLDLVGPGEEDALEASFVNGHAFLEIYPHVGRALFDFYPDYRDWVVRRTLDSMPAREWADAVLVPDDGARATYYEGLARQDLHRHLGTWLKDVSMREALDELETRAIRGALGMDSPVSTDDVLRVWSYVVSRFSWPEASRSVVPLLPAYDVERNEIGFYRLILPSPARMALRSGSLGSSPEIRRLPDDTLTDRPLALLVVEAMLADPVLGPVLRAHAAYAGHECHTFRGGARVIVRLRFDDAVAPGEASWFVNAEISRSATGSLRLVRLEAGAPKNNPGALTARILNARLTSMPAAIPMLFDDALQANLFPRP